MKQYFKIDVQVSEDGGLEAVATIKETTVLCDVKANMERLVQEAIDESREPNPKTVDKLDFLETEGISKLYSIGHGFYYGLQGKVWILIDLDEMELKGSIKDEDMVHWVREQFVPAEQWEEVREVPVYGTSLLWHA